MTNISRRNALKTIFIGTAALSPASKLLGSGTTPIKFRTPAGINSLTTHSQNPIFNTPALSRIAGQHEAAGRVMVEVSNDVISHLPAHLRRGAEGKVHDYLRLEASNEFNRRGLVHVAEGDVVEIGNHLKSLQPREIANSIQGDLQWGHDIGRSAIKLEANKKAEQRKLKRETEKKKQLEKQIRYDSMWLASLYIRAESEIRNGHPSGSSLKEIFSNGAINFPNYANDWTIGDLKPHAEVNDLLGRDSNQF